MPNLKVYFASGPHAHNPNPILRKKGGKGRYWKKGRGNDIERRGERDDIESRGKGTILREGVPLIYFIDFK